MRTDGSRGHGHVESDPVARCARPRGITDSYQTRCYLGILCYVRTRATDQQDVLHSTQQPYYDLGGLDVRRCAKASGNSSAADTWELIGMLGPGALTKLTSNFGSRGKMGSRALTAAMYPFSPETLLDGFSRVPPYALAEWE
jgi:hypothetical protein